MYYQVCVNGLVSIYVNNYLFIHNIQIYASVIAYLDTLCFMSLLRRKLITYHIDVANIHVLDLLEHTCWWRTFEG